MFKGIKKILGIEGVHIEIVVPESIDSNVTDVIEGQVNLLAKGDSHVKQLQFKLIEKYKRGRKDSKLIDEYVLGNLVVNGPIDLEKGDTKQLTFKLPFDLKNSEMDRLGKSNFVMKGIIGVAKFLKGAKSIYRIECICIVEGTKLNPHASTEILIK